MAAVPRLEYRSRSHKNFNFTTRVSSRMCWTSSSIALYKRCQGKYALAAHFKIPNKNNCSDVFWEIAPFSVSQHVEIFTKLSTSVISWIMFICNLSHLLFIPNAISVMNMKYLHFIVKHGGKQIITSKLRLCVETT